MHCCHLLIQYLHSPHAHHYLSPLFVTGQLVTQCSLSKKTIQMQLSHGTIQGPYSLKSKRCSKQETEKKKRQSKKYTINCKVTLTDFSFLTSKSVRGKPHLWCSVERNQLTEWSSDHWSPKLKHMVEQCGSSLFHGLAADSFRTSYWLENVCVCVSESERARGERKSMHECVAASCSNPLFPHISICHTLLGYCGKKKKQLYITQ